MSSRIFKSSLYQTTRSNVTNLTLAETFLQRYSMTVLGNLLLLLLLDSLFSSTPSAASATTPRSLFLMLPRLQDPS